MEWADILNSYSIFVLGTSSSSFDCDCEEDPAAAAVEEDKKGSAPALLWADCSFIEEGLFASAAVMTFFIRKKEGRCIVTLL